MNDLNALDVDDSGDKRMVVGGVSRTTESASRQ